MKPLWIFAAAALALAGCASLQEQRTARIVFCNNAAPIAMIAGQKVEGLDLINAVRERKPDRIVIMTESGGPMSMMAEVMAQAFRQAGGAQANAGGDRGVQFADTQADRAQATRLCKAQ